MREIGISYLVFDKDNTLTAHKKDKFYNEKIETKIQEECFKFFNKENVILVSNSLKTLDEIKRIENSLKMRVHLNKNNNKKPFNFEDIK